VTNLQTEALLHLAAADPGLPVPRIFPARNGMTELMSRSTTARRGWCACCRISREPRCMRPQGRPCCGVISAAAPHGSRGVFPISAMAGPITNCCGTFSTPPNCGR
jgi:hypothetical protein